MRRRAGDLRVSDWFRRRTLDGSDYTVERLSAAGRPSVDVILPARSVAATIAGVLDGVTSAKEAGLIDEIVVVGATPDDGTERIAGGYDVTYLDRDDLMPELGPCLGKGDALWRALSVTDGDIVLFLDTDTRNFDVGFVTGLLGPLLLGSELDLVKGAFGRPLLLGEVELEGEGGRVTELVARPLINLYLPELAAFVQPLAGELAARRSLLERLPFPVGYGVEIGLLADALRAVGLERLAQVDLGRREDRSKPLADLTPMAYSVMVTALRRAGVVEDEIPERIGLPRPEGMGFRELSTLERPPLRSLPQERAEGLR